MMLKSQLWFLRAAHVSPLPAPRSEELPPPGDAEKSPELSLLEPKNDRKILDFPSQNGDLTMKNKVLSLNYGIMDWCLSQNEEVIPFIQWPFRF